MRLMVACAALSMMGAAAQAQDLSGTYAMQGANPDGSAYEGTVAIAVAADAPCRITWTLSQATVEGLCMATADGLAAAYEAGGMVTLAVYVAGADGALSGTWTVEGVAGTGTEVLTPSEG